VKECEAQVKPVLIFQGEEFETKEQYQRLKNLLIDYFKVRELQETNLMEVRRIVAFTSMEDGSIIVRHYETSMPPSEAMVLA